MHFIIVLHAFSFNNVVAKQKQFSQKFITEVSKCICLQFGTNQIRKHSLPENHLNTHLYYKFRSYKCMMCATQKSLPARTRIHLRPRLLLLPQFMCRTGVCVFSLSHSVRCNGGRNVANCAAQPTTPGAGLPPIGRSRRQFCVAVARMASSGAELNQLSLKVCKLVMHR